MPLSFSEVTKQLNNYFQEKKIKKSQQKTKPKSYRLTAIRNLERSGDLNGVGQKVADGKKNAPSVAAFSEEARVQARSFIS